MTVSDGFIRPARKRRREHSWRIDYVGPIGPDTKGVSCSHCHVFIRDGVGQTVYCDEPPPSDGWATWELER